jgi:hypothetical protein
MRFHNGGPHFSMEAHPIKLFSWKIMSVLADVFKLFKGLEARR